MPGVERPAEDPVGRGAEGDWEVEGPVEDLEPPGGRVVRAGGTGLPLHHGCGKTGASWGRCSQRGVGSGAMRVGGGGRGAGRRGATAVPSHA